MEAVIPTHQNGTPAFEHFRRKRGACLFCARANKYLDPVYKKALAEEEADVKMTALMMDGRTGIPAFTIPMTHGEPAAPGAPDACAPNSPLSFEATRTPMARDPRT